MTPMDLCDDKEEYLGDGVYVSFVGDMIKLRAPRERGDHIVYIEPQVWKELARFAVKCFGEEYALLK